MRPCGLVRSLAALAAALILAGCASHAAPRGAAGTGFMLPPPPDPEIEAGAARNVVDAFLAAEAQGQPSADTLLTADADFIMTGIKVTVRPRLAGFNGPGAATIEEASSSVAGPVAWLVIRYAFEGRTADLGEKGRATIILEKQRAGWRIRHVHSSMVERW